MAKIPDSVVALLKDDWNPSEGYSQFDSTFTERPGRDHDPSFYIYRAGHEGLGTFTSSEIAALAKDSVFGQHLDQSGNSMIVNEHAQHALQDFLADVQDAWLKYQSRLNNIPVKRAEEH